jgi:hypothetical protein
MDNKKWNEFKNQFYRSNLVSQTDDGTIDFSLENFQKLETNGCHITYDEYLEIMRESGNHVRSYFEMCFYACGGYAECKGEIQNFARHKHKVVFKRIFVTGTYPDGMCFDGKEDHVWMDDAGFENFNVGDAVSFSAEVYRYLKTGKGKQIDYALRNPESIEKIESYELPSDDDLLMQFIDSIICESCLFTDHCYRVFCLNESWREIMRETLSSEFKNTDTKIAE